MLKPKKSVENMEGYYVPLFVSNWDIKIDSNENNYGPSEKVIQALNCCNTSNISFYPFYGELSQKIADLTGFKIDNIKLTNGADEAIQGIIQTYIEDGDSILTLDVSFDMPVIYGIIQNASIIKVSFKEKWVFPIDSFLKEISDNRIKLIYIATPNNPTGNVVSENDIRKIIEKAKDSAVIIDETYANYSQISYSKLVNEYDNVFIVKSFSKDFALAGMRLGYIISSSANILNLKKVISPFSVNSYALKAGLAALDDINYLNYIRKEINDSKEELKTFFESIGAYVYTSHANFLLVDFKDKAEYIYNKLLKNKISVKKFKKGSLLENHLRVTIPTKAGVERIKDILKLKRYLVFDMDGVLINAANSYRLAIAETYKFYSKKTISQEEIQKVKNLGGLNNDWDLTKFLLDRDGINISYEDIVNTFQKIYWDNGKGLINNETPLFDLNLFDELSKKYNLAIFTGRLRKEALFALEKFNLENYFYPIITTDDIPSGKGKPDSFGLNLIKMSTIGKKYFYFGDTIDDMICAKNAGYLPIGVLPPQDKSEELNLKLKLNGAEFVINSINNINEILEKTNEAMC